MKCEICNKEYSERGLRSHFWRIHTEEGKQLSSKFKSFEKGKHFNTNKVPWNKGLTKETDLKVKQCGITYSNKIKSGEIIPSFLGKHHTKETIKQLKKNAGGYRKGSGRGKSGWYKGFWCDSSWELVYVIYCLDNNIKIERNTKKFPYIYQNIKHNYIPDFILKDQNFVEIKGYQDLIWKAKYKSFPYKLNVITKKEIQFYIKYVIDKYGKNYINLLTR